MVLLSTANVPPGLGGGLAGNLAGVMAMLMLPLLAIAGLVLLIFRIIKHYHGNYNNDSNESNGNTEIGNRVIIALIVCTVCGKEVSNQAISCPNCAHPISNSTNGYNVDTISSLAKNKAAEGKASASLICGIIGLFFAGLVLGIIAIVQGNAAKRMGYAGGKATAGITLGIIGCVGWFFIIVLLISSC